MEQSAEINEYSNITSDSLIYHIATIRENKQARINELWCRLLNQSIPPYEMHTALCLAKDNSIVLPGKFIHDNNLDIRICFFKHVSRMTRNVKLPSPRHHADLISICNDIKQIDLEDPTLENHQDMQKRLLSSMVKLTVNFGWSSNQVEYDLAYLATYFLDIPNSVVQNIYAEHDIIKITRSNSQRYLLEINEILAAQKLKLIAMTDAANISLLDEEQLLKLIPDLSSQNLLLLFAKTANIRFTLFDRVRDTLRDLIAYHRGSLPTNVLSLTKYKKQQLIPYSLLTQVESIYTLELIRNGICEQAHVQLLKTLNEKFTDLDARDRKKILLPIAAYVNSLDTEIHYTKKALIDMITKPFQLNKLYEINAVTLEKMSEMAVRAGEFRTDTDCFKQYLEAIIKHMQDGMAKDVKLETKSYRINILDDLYTIHLPIITSCQNELENFLNSIKYMQHDLAINAVNLLKIIQENTQEYNTKINDKHKFLSYLQDNPEEIQIKTEIQVACNNRPLQYVMEQLKEYTRDSSTLVENTAAREVKAEPKEILKCQWLFQAMWQDYFKDEQRKQMLESKYFCNFMKIVMNLGMEFEDKPNFYDKYATHANELSQSPPWFCTKMAVNALEIFLAQSADLINNISLQNGLVLIAYPISAKAQASRVHNNAHLAQLNSVIGQANSRLVFFNNSLITTKKPHAQENRIMQNKTGECRIISLRCLSDDDIMEYLSSRTYLSVADIAQIKMSVNESSQELIKIITNNPGLNNQAILYKFIDVIDPPAAVTNSHNV